jgi:hypothetical protein
MSAPMQLAVGRHGELGGDGSPDECPSVTSGGGSLDADRPNRGETPSRRGWLRTFVAVTSVLVLLSSRPPPLATQEVWLDARNNNQTWFTGSFLPHYLRVRLVGLTPAECERRVVVFDAYSGGQASPDSANARWVVGDDERWDASAWCEAETRWRLSDATGVQKLRAWIAGLDVPATGDTLRRPIRMFEAVARASPRLMVGIAGILIGHSYDTLAVSNGDSAVVPIREQSTVIPMFGVETPILLPWLSRSAFARGLLRRVRVFVGASVTEPGRDFFFGIAPNPLLFGQQWEEIAFQLTLGVHVGRRTVLGSGEACAETLQSGATCQVTRFFWNYPFLSASMDASGLLTGVLRAIGIS